MARRLAAIIVLMLAAGGTLCAATIQGYILDPNWYARHPKATSLYGTGQYEYGVAGNIANSSALGFFSNTEGYAENFYWGVYGLFRKTYQPDGLYTIATWDNWWRPTFLFNQNMTPSSGPILLRLHATMWSYAPTWEANYNEHGQVFAATGSSVTMVVVRSAVPGVQVVASIHEGGPTGSQIGPSRSATTGGGPSDTRFIWNGGEVPTVPGHIYYFKLKCLNSASSAVLCNNEPIPDMSDAMPEGCAYHDGVAWTGTATPADRGAAMDLGLTICSDDDGVVTNMFVRPGGTNWMGATSAGQTFIARGTSLISFTAWLPGGGTFIAAVYDSVTGLQIGTAKRQCAMRAADPEVMWTYAPGEIPLVPGHGYTVEITREGGLINALYANQYNVYTQGDAYLNGVIQPGFDLAATIMEEESPGSATIPTVQFSSFPAVAPADRGANTLTIRWTTDAASDSTVEYAAWNAPYTNTFYSSASVTGHAATLTGLMPNTMYHLRVKSAAAGYRAGVTRDFVACTVNGYRPNLLANPGFEEGSGASPRKPVQGWNVWSTSSGGLDTAASDGTWFHGVPPYTGGWLFEGATNGGQPDAAVYQRVTGLKPGKKYHFTAAVSSWMREKIDNVDQPKYDVWNNSGRLSMMRIGIDPTGGVSPTAVTTRWMPWMYSHFHYTGIGIRDTVVGTSATVFVAMKGTGGSWHIYGIDDCRFSEEEVYDSTPPDAPVVVDDGLLTTDTSQLHAVWSGSDAESGIDEYQVAVGTTPGGTDVVPFTSVGTATEVTRGGLSLSPGQTYFISVKALNGVGLWSAAGTSDGIGVPPPAGTVAEAKSFADGTAVQLRGRIVSAKIGSSVWVQDGEFEPGIRVQSAAAVSPGDLVDVTGKLVTVEGERRIDDAHVGVTGNAAAPAPACMDTRALGGADLNAFTPGVAPAFGPNNIGQFAAVYGRVTRVAAAYFYIDDGAGRRDGTSDGGPNVGVRVVATAPGVLQGDFVMVRGASSSFSNPLGQIQPALIPVEGGIAKLFP